MSLRTDPCQAAPVPPTTAGPVDFVRGVHELLADLPRCRGEHELVELVGSRIDRLLRPRACAILLTERERLQPAFLCGDTELARLEAPDSLQHAFGASHQEPPEEPSAPRHRSLLAPIRCNGSLLGAITLVPQSASPRRRIGPLLELVGAALASELQHRRVREELQRQRRLNETLARYVPGAVVDRLERGLEFDQGEREVSVLFVDIHHYTSYAECLAPREIFALVNTYTRAVSRIVCARGGTIVEFNGDGMMAVFGAPERLPGKEHAAVAAACEIVREVEDGTRVPGNGPVSAGVGVATGMAFAGSMEAVDRLIWSAIGNTTNLASRLQRLTHAFDAKVVIDATTFERAGAAGASFRLHAGTPIRGRRHPVDVYVLGRGGESKSS